MNNTQKVLKNKHICEQATPNLGITQSSGFGRRSLRHVFDAGDSLCCGSSREETVVHYAYCCTCFFIAFGE